MSAADRPAGTGRLLAGVAWAVLLLGLWFWGREITDGPGGTSAPTTGDVAAVGRPLGVPCHPRTIRCGPRRRSVWTSRR